MALIDVRDVTRAYAGEGGGTAALRGVTFSVDAGEFVAIMGPSGSGKSTLLHILGFLDRPSSGHYRFDGMTMETLPDEERARVRSQKAGFVFQMFNLLPRTTVLDNVKLPLVYAGVPDGERERRAREALAAVGMTHRLTHTTSQLSGGERQRVAIARALVNNPRVIFADEPTGNLDSASGQHVLESLERLHRAGTTVILVTHERYLAERAQRMLTLRDGRILSDHATESRRSPRERAQE